MNSSDLVMAGSYNYGLVALSIVIAMLGSYATIDLAARVKASQGGSRLLWRIGGALAMAIGTWSMHYTGMLAFRLPVPILYDWRTSVLSFLPSLFASAVALLVVIRPKMESPRAFVGSIFMGAGIAGLHYTAMASMRFQGVDRYSPALVTLSVLLAMVFSLLSIWLTFLFLNGPRAWKLRKLGSVGLLGTAIWIMHYTGMASASYIEAARPPDFSHAVRISELSGAGIGTVALMVLTVALLTSTCDRLQMQSSLLRATGNQLRSLSASLESAREEERKRIAREIHDELGSDLSSLRWQLEDLDESITETNEAAQLNALRQKIQGMIGLIDNTISVVRRISWELRSVVLDDLGLIEAIEEQGRLFQARTGMICRFETSLERVDLRQEQSATVFRIVQEAMTNILRHARATRVGINIKIEDGEFVLTIIDNGRGITDEEKAGLQSLGLIGIRERAHLIGAKITIVGIEGRGTTIDFRTQMPSGADH